MPLFNSLHPHEINISLLQVQESPVSPASTNNTNGQTSDTDTTTQHHQQVLLSTMQPVSVLDLHESNVIHHHIALHPKYLQQSNLHNHHNGHHHNNHNHHPKYGHHQQLNNNHHSQEDQDQVVGHEDDPEHKMIDLIYNDGVKTVMYTHDKEIIYESQVDRVQVVEYPPPQPSPPSPQASNNQVRGLVPLNCVQRTPNGQVQTTSPDQQVQNDTGSGTTTLHLHHYPTLQLDGQDLTRGLATHQGTGGNGPSTTTTVLVLSELVAADQGVDGTHLAIPLGTAVTTLRNE